MSQVYYEAECRKKKSESVITSRQLTNYASNADYDDRGKMFVVRHKENSMTGSNPTNTSNLEDVWFVDSGASNHMTSHEDWFWELRKPERPDYLETRDDNSPHSSCPQCPIWGRR